MSCNYPDCRSVGCDKSPKECAALHPVRSEPLLEAADALADACDKHSDAARCSTDLGDWSDTLEAIEVAVRVYRELRTPNAAAHLRAAKENANE